MGSSESSTVKTVNRNVPPKSILRKSTIPPPVSRYGPYPNGYVPQQYGQPVYPMASPEGYRQNQLYPLTEAQNTIPEHQSPSRHHHHHHHGRHSHHHHHHHHRHPSQSPSEHRRFNASIHEELSMASRSPPSPPPPAPPSSIQTQMPVSPFVTSKASSSPAKKENTPPLIVQKSPTVRMVEQPSSSIVEIKRQIPQAVPHERMPSSLLVPSSSFQKAPPIETNYIIKSPDDISVHSYGPGPLTVVRRSPSHYLTSGNRWYDHDYDKRVKPLTINDF